MNPNFFFSNFSGAPGISRQNPGISRPKSLISLVSRDVSNFLGPTHSRERPLPHWKISGPKSLGLGSFFLPDQNQGQAFPKDATKKVCDNGFAELWGELCGAICLRALVLLGNALLSV